MTKKKTDPPGKVSVSLWLTSKEIEQLGAIVNSKTESFQSEYPGVKLTRHSVMQKIVRDWLEGQEV